MHPSGDTSVREASREAITTQIFNQYFQPNFQANTRLLKDFLDRKTIFSPKRLYIDTFMGHRFMEQTTNK